jgi:hypothetical protein
MIVKKSGSFRMLINLDPFSLVDHRSVFTGTTGVIVLRFPFEFCRRFETGIQFFSARIAADG